ncbi:hypothetical protein AAG906_016595 [Vitis piasezkii]
MLAWEGRDVAKSRGGLRGGSSWFAVESKAVVLERSSGFSSWIRFGELSLCCLRERVEFGKMGTKFRLEFRSNERQLSLLCSVATYSASKFAALRSMKGTYVDLQTPHIRFCVVILERGVRSFMGKVLRFLRWDVRNGNHAKEVWVRICRIATSGGRIILLCRSFMVGSTTLGLLGGSDDRVVWELWFSCLWRRIPHPSFVLFSINKSLCRFQSKKKKRLAKGTTSGLEKGGNCGETDGNMVVWKGEELGQGDVQPWTAPLSKEDSGLPLISKRLGQLQIPSLMEIGGLRRCQSMESRVEGLVASRPEIIDEALMDKASEGIQCCLWFGGFIRGGDYDPLQVVLANESALGNESLEEQILSLVDCTFAIGLALVPNGWIPKRLWSMPIEGFKEEILYLLKRTKTRIDQRGQAGTNRRTISLPSRVLKFVGLEAEVYSISCHFKNWEDGGDFSMIRFLRERSRGGLSPYMKRFSEVIKQLELRDIPLQGGPFTWSGRLNNQSHSRLDQFLVLED